MKSVKTQEHLSNLSVLHSWVNPHQHLQSKCNAFGVVLCVGLTPFMHHCTQNSNKWSLGIDRSGFAAWYPVWSGCLWDLAGLVVLHSAGQIHGLEAGRGGLVLLALSHWQGPFRVVGHSVRALSQEKDKSNNAECIVHWTPRWAVRNEEKCWFTPESQIQTHSLSQIFFLFSFIYDCDISVLCIYLLLPGVPGLHISFAQMGCITLWRMISVLERCLCQVPCMLSLIYCLPGDRLSPTGG